MLLGIAGEIESSNACIQPVVWILYAGHLLLEPDNLLVEGLLLRGEFLIGE